MKNNIINKSKKKIGSSKNKTIKNKKGNRKTKKKKRINKLKDLFNNRTSVINIHSHKWTDRIRNSYKLYRQKNDMYRNSKLFNKHKNFQLKEANRTMKINKNNVIIGILSISIDNTKEKIDAGSYLAQSYVKWIESTGARVIPIQFDLPLPVIISLLNQINGLLLPGGNIGGDDKKQLFYMSRVQFIVNFITRQNLIGNYFPIYGICLGYQLLIMAVLEKTPELALKNYYNLVNISKLYFNGEKSIHLQKLSKKDNNVLISPFMNDMFTDKDIYNFKNNGSAYFYHNYIFSMTGKYMNKIRDFVIPTMIVKYYNKEYMCGYQFKSLPYYATLFHPEKNFFIWTQSNIPRNIYSNKISYELSNFFVNECKKNYNIYKTGTNQENSLFIENYDLLSYDNTLRTLFPKNIKKDLEAFSWTMGPCYYFGKNDNNTNLL